MQAAPNGLRLPCSAPCAARRDVPLPGVLHAASRPCSRFPSSVRDTSVRSARTDPGHPEARLSGFRRFLDPAVGRPGPPVLPEGVSLPTLAPSLPICRPAQDTPPVPSSGRPSPPGRGRRIHPAIRGILRVAPVAAARIRHHLPRVSPHISAAVSWPSRESMPRTDTATGLLNGTVDPEPLRLPFPGSRVRAHRGQRDTGLRRGREEERPRPRPGKRLDVHGHRPRHEALGHPVRG